jgi:hypothetical protein
MRSALVLLTIGLFVAGAGMAAAHYAVEEDTPVGHVCALNMELIIDGLRDRDVDAIQRGVLYIGDC